MLELHLSAPAPASTVGSHPLFVVTLRVEGECENLGPAIQLSRDGWKTVDRTWSQKESPLGWRFEGSDSDLVVAFRPPEGLEEDGWQWRARVMTSGVVTESQRASAFRVDVTPPAEIEGLRLQRRPDGAVQLKWDPVTLDVEGRPDTVDHYTIYRYDRRGTFPQGPLVKIGESRTPAWVDRRGASSREGTSGLSLSGDDDSARSSGGAPDDPPARPVPPAEAGSTRPTAPPPGREVDAGSSEEPAAGGSTRGQAQKGAKDRDRQAPRGSAAGSATVYYKIVAVDIAGNELGMREGSVRPQRTDRKKVPPRTETRR